MTDAERLRELAAWCEKECAENVGYDEKAVQNCDAIARVLRAVIEEAARARPRTTEYGRGGRDVCEALLAAAREDG